MDVFQKDKTTLISFSFEPSSTAGHITEKEKLCHSRGLSSSLRICVVTFFRIVHRYNGPPLSQSLTLYLSTFLYTNGKKSFKKPFF